MAKINVYNPQVTPNVPQKSSPIQASEMMSWRGKLSQQLAPLAQQAGGFLTKRQIANDIAEANAKVSEIQKKFTDKWDEAVRTGDPSNKEFYEKFMQEYDDESSKLAENIWSKEGLAHYQKASQKLRSIIDKSARSVQAQYAGIRAKTNYQTAQNNFTSSLITNPAAFEDTLSLHDEAISGLVSSGMLPAVKAEELRGKGRADLAEAAIKGWIKQDPSFAKKNILSGKWDEFLDGNKKNTLITSADQEIRARQVEGERHKALTEKVRREKNRAIQADFQEKVLNFSLTAKEVMDSELPPFGSGSKQQFLNMLRRQAKADFDNTDPVLYNDLFSRIHADPDDPNYLDDENELNEYAFGQGLSQEDVSFLAREIRAKKLQPDSIESSMKKSLIDDVSKKLSRSNPLSGYIDEVGEAKVHKFSAVLRQEYDKEIRNGKSPIDLLDPNSPNYLGRISNQFIKSEREVISEMAQEKRKKDLINGFNPKQKEAYSWATKNKSDPRAKEILKRLGVGE